MGSCGCGDGTNPVAFFPGPDGLTYGLALYLGCRECSIPVAVILSEIPDGEMQNFAPPEDRGAVPWAETLGWREWWLPIIHQRFGGAVWKVASRAVKEAEALQPRQVPAAPPSSGRGEAG